MTKPIHRVAFDKRRPMPRWINDAMLCPSSKDGRNYRYFVRIWIAQPSWQSPDPIRAIYERASALRDQGYDVVVDHIVPLRSDIVCGLHVPWNLHITDVNSNSAKGNRWWPGMPYEQTDFFNPRIEDDGSPQNALFPY